jgi:hypothetical protein
MSGQGAQWLVGGILKASGHTPPWEKPSAAPAPSSTPAQQQQSQAADSRAAGRSDTILTDYALATKDPATLKATLGG